MEIEIIYQNFVTILEYLAFYIAPACFIAWLLIKFYIKHYVKNSFDKDSEEFKPMTSLVACSVSPMKTGLGITSLS